MEEILKFLRKNIYANPKALRNAFIELKKNWNRFPKTPMNDALPLFGYYILVGKQNSRHPGTNNH